MGLKFNIKLLLGLLITLAILFAYGSFYFEKKEPLEKDSVVQDVPMIENIGVNLDYYDSKTQKAGDFVFTQGKVFANRIFVNYGHFIPKNSASPGKFNPQPTFALPLGTKVFSLVSGVVVGVPKLYSGDYSVMVSKEIGDVWVYELEHVINPSVKVGDKVFAGQIVAEVSPHDFKYNDGMGLVEIGILKGGNPPKHVCPFKYLNPIVEKEVYNKILSFYKSWETFRGNSSIYDEEKMVIPGCEILDFIEG